MITFFFSGTLVPGTSVVLGDDAAQHARVRRVHEGDPAGVLNGRGQIGEGRITGLSRNTATVILDSVMEIAPPTPLDVIVPVADRDRMLLAAEKCAELQVTAWRPAYFARSRSVSPRGEGEKFRARTLARMESALEQSGAGWLPTLHEEREAMDVLSGVPSHWTRVLLDSHGTSLREYISNGPMALAAGPEGGFEAGEVERARSLGWHVARLSSTTLRFETAIIAAVSVVRALRSSDTPPHG